VIGVVVPRINQATRRAQESVGVMGAALERMFGAFRTVKASGAEEREGRRVQDAATEAWRAGVRSAKWSAIAGNTAGLAAQTAIIAVLGVGGARVASGDIDVATLVAFLLYVYYLMPPINSLVSAVTQYQVAAAAVTRIQQVQALPWNPARPHPSLPGCATGLRLPANRFDSATSPAAEESTTASASRSARRRDRLRRRLSRRDHGLLPTRGLHRPTPVGPPRRCDRSDGLSPSYARSTTSNRTHLSCRGRWEPALRPRRRGQRVGSHPAHRSA
jgi:ABC-type multidrug transport system fused ATPase/permease subunit